MRTDREEGKSCNNHVQQRYEVTSKNLASVLAELAVLNQRYNIGSKLWLDLEA
jgi:hypothetical protein